MRVLCQGFKDNGKRVVCDRHSRRRESNSLLEFDDEDDSNNPMDRCPNCGSGEGYYTKQQVKQVSGTVQYRYRFDGEPADNGDMYNSLNFRGGKRAYCIDCHKKLFDMPE